MTNLLIIPEIKTATRTFSTNTRRGTIIEISFLDLETPVVKAATMIMDVNKPTVRRRSLRKLIYRNRAFQRWCDAALQDYLAAVNEKLFADCHEEVYGEQVESELYSVDSVNYEA